jgi:hypothetical protein
MLAGTPFHGGATWAVLQYVLGLADLGHDVYFVEPIEGEQEAYVDAAAQYFRSVVAEFDLSQRAALLAEGTEQTIGLPYGRLLQIAQSADLLLNLSGILTDVHLIDPIASRVYVDLDPVFTQFWQARDGIDMHFGGHTHFVTVGMAIGSPECPVPTCDLEWIPTLQPVVLDRWPVAKQVTHDALTTIANWRGYGSVWDGDIQYGQKVHSLRPLIGLAERSPKPIELALNIHRDESTDLEALTSGGWRLVDPSEVTATPGDYQRFIQGSWAEFGLAKSGYVLAHSGWFSDRSICYLASGRPVLGQDTGFSAYLPVGQGLLAFSSEDEALAGIEELCRDYSRHRKMAREIAEAHFDSRIVLSGLIDRLA